MAENRDDRIKKNLSSLISQVRGETAELKNVPQEIVETKAPEDPREKGFFLIVYYDGKKQKRCTMVSEWEWVESENGSPIDCHGFFYCRGKKYRVMGLSKEDFDRAVSFDGVCLDFSGYRVVAENNKRDPYIRNTKDIPLPDQDVYKAGGAEPVTHSAEWVIFPEGVTLKVTDSIRGEKLSEKVYAAMQKREKFKLITVFEDYANPGKTYTNYKINGRTFKALLKTAESTGEIDIQKMDKTYAFNEYLDAAFDSPLQEYRKAKIAAQEAGKTSGSARPAESKKAAVKAEEPKKPATTTEETKAKEPAKSAPLNMDLSDDKAMATGAVAAAGVAAAATVTVTAANVAATSSMNLEDTQELVEKLMRETAEEPKEVLNEENGAYTAQGLDEEAPQANAQATEEEAEAETAEEFDSESAEAAEQTEADLEEATKEAEEEAAPAEEAEEESEVDTASEEPEAPAAAEAEAEPETEEPEEEAAAEETADAEAQETSEQAAAEADGKSTFFSIDATEELRQKPAPLEEGLTGKTVTVSYVMETSELNQSMMPEALKPAGMRENLSPEEIARREAEAEEKRQELLAKKQQEAVMAELIAQKLAAATVEKTPEQKAAEAEAARKAEEEAAAARAAERAAKRLEEAEAEAARRAAEEEAAALRAQEEAALAAERAAQAQAEAEAAVAKAKEARAKQAARKKAKEESSKQDAAAALTAAALAAATGREGGDPLEMIQPGAAGVDDSTARLEGISDRLAKAVEQLTKLAELGEIEPILQEVDGGLDVLNSGAVKFKFLNEKGVRQTAYLDRIYYDYDGDCTYFVTTDGLQYYNPRVKKDEYRAIEFEMMDGAKEVNICKQGITSIYVPETYEEKKKQFMRRNNIQDPLS